MKLLVEAIWPLVRAGYKLALTNDRSREDPVWVVLKRGNGGVLRDHGCTSVVLGHRAVLARSGFVRQVNVEHTL